MSSVLDEDATEVENVAIALHAVAYQLAYLGNGNASTHVGAIEGLSMNIKEGCDSIVRAISDLAEAVRQHGEL